MATQIQILIARILNIGLGIILIFLGMRFIFRLVGANAQTPFVSWIYGVSDIFITPFRGIIQNPTLANGALVDVVALISMVAYSIGVYLIIWVISSIVHTFSDTNRITTHSHA